MKDLNKLVIKIANREDEFQQIHKLNYDTFVDEIGQHQGDGSGVRVDPFDSENTYFIALLEGKIIGMLALRDKRPFSLDRKVDDLDKLLPIKGKTVEVRLLTVDKQFRYSKVLWMLIRVAITSGPGYYYDLGIISGIINQNKLYRHIGFEPMGEPVGGEVKFQPMYITKDNVLKLARHMERKDHQIINYLPGPVEIEDNVIESFASRPISHRSLEFRHILEETKEMLLSLTGAYGVEIITGTGTAANDTVAAQLKALNGKGLILSNGEFGERLYRHADGAGLQFDRHRIEWGDSYSDEEISELLEKGSYQWLWLAHHETSTGILNNLDSISAICKEHDVKCCADIISSIGVEKVNLKDIYLASAVSSKGIASYSGLAMIFYHRDFIPASKGPAAYDIKAYMNKGGVPYTISSNVLFALNQSIKNIIRNPERGQSIRSYILRMRERIQELGLKIISPDQSASSSTITIVLGQEFNSRALGDFMKQNDLLLSYESSYLLDRNWVQVVVMGQLPTEGQSERLLFLLREYCS